MQEVYKELPLVKTDDRFEMIVDDYTAIIEYKQSPGWITLLHTEVPPELRGQGAATAIIEKVLEYIEENNLKLVAYCPMVIAFLKRHPEWQRIT